MSRYRKFLAVTSALALASIASVALFMAIQRLGVYIALVKGQFYPPMPTSAETMFANAFSRSGLLILRSALWPCLVFFVLQAAAAYSISTLLHFRGRFALTRRLIAGAALSVLTSVLVLAAIRSVL